MMMMILAAEGSLPPFVRPSEGGDNDAGDAAENAASAAGQVISTRICVRIKDLKTSRQKLMLLIVCLNLEVEQLQIQILLLSC